MIIEFDIDAIGDEYLRAKTGAGRNAVLAKYSLRFDKPMIAIRADLCRHRYYINNTEKTSLDKRTGYDIMVANGQTWGLK